MEEIWFADIRRQKKWDDWVKTRPICPDCGWEILGRAVEGRCGKCAASDEHSVRDDCSASDSLETIHRKGSVRWKKKNGCGSWLSG